MLDVLPSLVKDWYSNSNPFCRQMLKPCNDIPVTTTTASFSSFSSSVTLTEVQPSSSGDNSLTTSTPVQEDGETCFVIENIVSGDDVLVALSDQSLQSSSCEITFSQLKCNYCPYVTNHMTQLEVHAKQFHPPGSARPPLECSLCQKAFNALGDMQHHMKVDHSVNLFTCPYCQAQFGQHSTYSVHLRKHTKERPFPCSFCPYRSATKGNLQNHVRSKHPESCFFNCKYCPFVSNSVDMHRRHLKTHEEHERLCKPFGCEVCPYRSSTKAGLQAHIQTKHIGIKRFFCSQCPYRAHTKTLLVNHVLKHHPLNTTGGGPAATQMSPATIQMSPATSKMSPATTQMSPATTQMSPATTQMSPATTQMSPATTQMSPATTQMSPATTQM